MIVDKTNQSMHTGELEFINDFACLGLILCNRMGIREKFGEGYRWPHE